MDTPPVTPPTAGARTCAVCRADLPDPPPLRCPVCHSRFSRAGDGPGLSVLPAPPPPPRRDAPRQGARGRLDPTAGKHLLAAGLGLLIAGAGLLGLGATQAGSIVAIVGGVGLAWGLAREVLRPSALAAARARCCVACGYPVAEGHHGRCTECGAVLVNLPQEERFCPGCRRALRGFRGDACPECGADVRAICEATENDPPERDG